MRTSRWNWFVINSIYMTRGYVPRLVSIRKAPALPTISPLLRALRFARLMASATVILILLLGAASLPLMADGADVTSPQPAANGQEDFGQYLVDHQADLAPFFENNSGDLLKMAVPMVLEMVGWLIFFTMLAGWVVDVLMSRAFAFFFAPAYPELKRSLLYATGGLFLSFIYTCLIGLAVVFSLKLAHAGIVILLAVLLLAIVAFAAQIVWILYLYRTNFAISVVFYLALIAVHGLVGVLMIDPILGSRAPSAMTNFIDQAITPKLQAEAEATKRQLATVKSTLDADKEKASDLQNQIVQAQAEEERLGKEIEDKKNSDLYVFTQIVKVRANGDLDSARRQLIAFLAQFPASNVTEQARLQLSEINSQLALEETQKEQQDAGAAQAAALARADLLARAAKGEVTLSEMRQALIGKTRAQVSDLLGQPAETASDTWGYSRQMIVNPLTNEKHGLMVYFAEGIVQSVDYDRNGGTQ